MRGLRELILALSLLFLLGLFLLSGRSGSSPYDFVLEDARSRYPDAEVVEVLSRTDLDGRELVKVRVSGNLSSVCPYRIHLYYLLPQKVPERPEVITQGCQLRPDVYSAVLYPEEAIVLSHLYLQALGISHDECQPMVSETLGGWRVDWCDLRLFVSSSGAVRILGR